LDIVSRRRSVIRAYSAQLDCEVDLEASICRPLIKGTEMRPYVSLDPVRTIIFPYEKEGTAVSLIPKEKLKREYPRAYAYLLENKTVLTAREGGRVRVKEWYCYSRNQALDVVSDPKIITPDLAPRSSFLLDAGGELFFLGGAAGGYGLLLNERLDPLFALGLLNSKLLSYWISMSGQQIESGYFTFEARFIRSTPIRLPSGSDAQTVREHEISQAVRGMLDLRKQIKAARTDHEIELLQRQIDTTDRQIDALVYELYGLTEEEIAIVEASKK